MPHRRGAHGEWVAEIDRPKRPRGRNGAKSDPLDAIRAGREALSREHLACPRQRGQREALRVLQLTRSGAVKVAADARRHLKALLVTAPEPLRQTLRSETWLVQARAWAALQADPAAPVEDRATVRALRLTTERALAAHAEAEALEKELRVLVEAMAPCCWSSPASARSLPRRCWWAGHIRAGCARRRPSPCSRAWRRSRPLRAGSSATG